MHQHGPADGGPVVGTGGGKFGKPLRWARPENVRPDSEVYMAIIPVGGVGPSVYRRRTLSIDLVVGKTQKGWEWLTRAPGAVRRIQQRAGCEPDLAGAQRAAVAAAREVATEAATHPVESAQHPPVGPVVWPGA